MGLRGGAVRSPVRVREKHKARAHRFQRAYVGSKYHGQPQRRLRQEARRAAHHATLNGGQPRHWQSVAEQQEKKDGLFSGGAKDTFPLRVRAKLI